jgi:hypothetical protein
MRLKHSGHLCRPVAKVKSTFALITKGRERCTPAQARNGFANRSSRIRPPGVIRHPTTISQGGCLPSRKLSSCPSSSGNHPKVTTNCRENPGASVIQRQPAKGNHQLSRKLGLRKIGCLLSSNGNQPKAAVGCQENSRVCLSSSGNHPKVTANCRENPGAVCHPATTSQRQSPVVEKTGVSSVIQRQSPKDDRQLSRRLGWGWGRDTRREGYKGMK